MRLKEYGSDALEVIDNGLGVQPVNFAGLSKALLFITWISLTWLFYFRHLYSFYFPWFNCTHCLLIRFFMPSATTLFDLFQKLNMSLLILRIHIFWSKICKFINQIIKLKCYGNWYFLNRQVTCILSKRLWDLTRRCYNYEKYSWIISLSEQV